MLEYKENNVNCEILKYLKYDLKGKKIDIYELIVRAEENIKENGIIIKDKSIDELNKIIADISECSFNEVINYLKENSIYYEEIKFIQDEPNKEKNGWYLFQGVIGMVNLARTYRLITGFQAFKLKRKK